MHNYNN